MSCLTLLELNWNDALMPTSDARRGHTLIDRVEAVAANRVLLRQRTPWLLLAYPAPIDRPTDRHHQLTYTTYNTPPGSSSRPRPSSPQQPPQNQQWMHTHASIAAP